MDPRKAAALSRFKTPLLAEWMLAQILEATDTTSQAGREQVAVTFAPVVNNVPQRDLSIRGYIGRPQEGDDPLTLKRIRERNGGFVRAIDPEFPRYPTRIGNGVYEVMQDISCTLPSGEVVEYAAGQQIGWKEYSHVADEVDATVMERLMTLGGVVEDLPGKRIYIKPQKARLDDAGRISQFIGSYSAELSDGTSVADETVLDESQAQEFLAAMGLLDEEE
jgi:hypothetical protein